MDRDREGAQHKENYKNTNIAKLHRFYNFAAKTHEDAIDCWKWRVENDHLDIYLDDIREMSEKFVKGSKILVVGCSIGYQVYGLKKLGFDAHGCDISEWAIERGIVENLTCCNIIDTPYSDMEFDAVLATDIMEHLPIEWVDLALIEISRITKSCFLSRTPFDKDTPTYQFKIEKVFSEHMINEDAPFWSSRIRKFFPAWKETIWYNVNDPDYWKFYLYEKEKEC